MIIEFTTKLAFVKASPMPNVALENERARGAQPGHIEVKNEGKTARNPWLFL